MYLSTHKPEFCKDIPCDLVNSIKNVPVLCFMNFLVHVCVMPMSNKFFLSSVFFFY
jgi:hypothetical protein